jgi:hypothetical protein
MNGDLSYLELAKLRNLIRDYKQQGWSGADIRDVLRASAKQLLGNPTHIPDDILNPVLNDLLGAEGIEERIF